MKHIRLGFQTVSIRGFFSSLFSCGHRRSVIRTVTTLVQSSIGKGCGRFPARSVDRALCPRPPWLFIGLGEGVLKCFNWIWSLGGGAELIGEIGLVPRSIRWTPFYWSQSSVFQLRSRSFPQNGNCTCANALQQCWTEKLETFHTQTSSVPSVYKKFKRVFRLRPSSWKKASIENDIFQWSCHDRSSEQHSGVMSGSSYVLIPNFSCRNA